MKAAPNEERPVLVLFDKLADAARCGAIGLLLVFAIGRRPRELAGASAFFRMVLVLYVAFLQRDSRAALRNIPVDCLFVSSVGDLADACREVALSLEVLRQEDDVTEIGSRR